MEVLLDDRALLDGFRRGDRKALETVYFAHVDDIAKILRNGLVTTNGGRVEGLKAEEHRDLVQETFAKAFAEQARQRYDGLRPYGPYLNTIARNLLVDHARKRGRELPTDEGWEERLVSEHPEEVTIEPWEDPVVGRVVEAYVAALGEPLSSVYQHRYVLDHSQVETGDALGLTRQKVRTLEDKIRKGLRKALRKAGRGR